MRIITVKKSITFTGSSECNGGRLKRSLCLFIALVLLSVMSISCGKSEDGPKNVAVTSIRLNMVTLTLSIGETAELVATVLPEDAADKAVTWSSSNTAIATVSNGKITAVSVGTATVTAQCGGVKAECSVTVNPIEVTSITLDKISALLTVGRTVDLTATIQPENAADKTLIWTSSDTKIATVTSGRVTAVSTGSVAITAKSSNGITAICIVVVSNESVPPGGTEGIGEIEWEY